MPLQGFSHVTIRSPVFPRANFRDTEPLQFSARHVYVSCHKAKKRRKHRNTTTNLNLWEVHKIKDLVLRADGLERNVEFVV